MTYQFHDVEGVGYMMISESTGNDMPMAGVFFPQDTGFVANVESDNELWSVWV